MKRTHFNIEHILTDPTENMKTVRYHNDYFSDNDSCLPVQARGFFHSTKD